MLLVEKKAQKWSDSFCSKSLAETGAQSQSEIQSTRKIDSRHSIETDRQKKKEKETERLFLTETLRHQGHTTASTKRPFSIFLSFKLSQTKVKQKNIYHFIDNNPASMEYKSILKVDHPLLNR